MKAMAIAVSTLLTLGLVALIVLFLFLGVLKDFMFQHHSRFGLVPGTETVFITDNNLKDKVSIGCAKTADKFIYTVKLDSVGFSYAKEAKVFPVFLFKNAIASSKPQEVTIPGRISFESLGIVSNIGPSTFGSESIVIGFFKRNERCLDLARSQASIDKFINECAKSLEVETSMITTAPKCV